VVDFARGRLGGGIALQPSSIADVGALLRPVVEELRSVYPERHVDLTIEGSGRMSGDPVCLAQLLQNLLANALSHSPPGTPVAVSIRALADRLVLSVTNGGPAIPDEIRGRMFEPYRRGTDATPGGLGLGLYIASQIVRSHAGTIEATSVDGETTIVCSIPRRDA
jgi:signal transduction histidine kinase